MRRRRLRYVGTAAAAGSEDIDSLREDRPAAADTMFLHQDRQHIAFLVEIGELFAEPEEPLVGYRLRSQLYAVDACRRLGFDFEPQVRR
jgi:hypothetical protein